MGGPVQGSAMLSCLTENTLVEFVQHQLEPAARAMGTYPRWGEPVKVARSQSLGGREP